MTTSTECERLRLERMAWFDGEGAALSEPQREHFSTCSSCQRWLAQFESMTAQLQDLEYPGNGTDLWTTVKTRIDQPDPTPWRTHRLWSIGALLLGGRALQLSVDLPIPLLQLLVPLAAASAIVILWKVAGDPLTIETWAPELRKGDV